jgi:hypothetical protein
MDKQTSEQIKEYAERTIKEVDGTSLYGEPVHRHNKDQLIMAVYWNGYYKGLKAGRNDKLVNCISELKELIGKV